MEGHRFLLYHRMAFEVNRVIIALMHRTVLRFTLAGAFVFAHLVRAQSKYLLVEPAQVQARLDLYKGDDIHRELALKNAFVEAGCTGPNLTEQTVPHRKQPNLICTLPGSGPGMIVVG